jgi:signal transduction histidine kinase
VRSTRHRLKDGRVVEVELSSTVIEFAGRPARLVLAQDVTEQRQAERARQAYELELAALTQRLLVQEQETTRRLAQALHDQLGQTLAAARLYAEGLQSSPRSEQPAVQVLSLIDAAMQQLRLALADLRPPGLEEHGLVRALTQELQRQRHFGPSAAVPHLQLKVQASAHGQRWPAELEYGVFMIAREALANAVLHARASNIVVSLKGSRRGLELRVQDNGTGIAPHLRGGREGHLGLIGMRERALAVGAQMLIEPARGSGTRVVLRWPH